MRVLVIDDSISTRKIVQFVLKDLGCEVDEASNGIEGLQCAVQKQYDLVITDVNMPMKNGFETVKDLRRDANYRQTPVLIMTTESDVDKRQRGKDVGATAWVVKPFNPDLFKKIITRLLPEQAQSLEQTSA